MGLIAQLRWGFIDTENRDLLQRICSSIKTFTKIVITSMKNLNQNSLVNSIQVEMFFNFFFLYQVVDDFVTHVAKSHQI